MSQPGNPQKAVPLLFTLAKGKQQGNQTEMQVNIETAMLAPGRYSLRIRQVNGVTTDVPIAVHPPNPELTEIPLRVNMSEPYQSIMLHGKHLDRIEKIIGAHADWALEAISEGVAEVTELSATIKLAPTLQKGDHLGAEILVSGLEKPLKIDDIARVVLGHVIRLPRITNFVLTDVKLGDSSYAATLTGRDLQLIEKTGWGATVGETVPGIPTPVPGSPPGTDTEDCHPVASAVTESSTVHLVARRDSAAADERSVLVRIC